MIKCLDGHFVEETKHIPARFSHKNGWKICIFLSIILPLSNTIFWVPLKNCGKVENFDYIKTIELKKMHFVKKK